mmetsp:Transcript_20265/g.55232  ORF Transcript_20265/g.55232 Transcript_20265/m.55232 type:complete len:304 (+) Transcript_20265:1719-2630(+)
MLRRLRRRRQPALAGDQGAAEVRGRPLRGDLRGHPLQHAGVRQGLRAGEVDAVVRVLQGLRLGHQDPAPDGQARGRGPRRVPGRGQPRAARAQEVQRAALHQGQEHAADVLHEAGPRAGAGRKRQRGLLRLGGDEEVRRDVPEGLRGPGRGRPGLPHPLQRPLLVQPDAQVCGLRSGAGHGQGLQGEHGPALQQRREEHPGEPCQAGVAPGHHAHLSGTRAGAQRAHLGPRRCREGRAGHHGRDPRKLARHVHVCKAPQGESAPHVWRCEAWQEGPALHGQLGVEAHKGECPQDPEFPRPGEP